MMRVLIWSCGIFLAIAAIFCELASSALPQSLPDKMLDANKGLQDVVPVIYQITPINRHAPSPYNMNGSVAALSDTGSFAGAIVTKDIEFATFVYYHKKFQGVEMFPTDINARGQAVGNWHLAIPVNSNARARFWQKGLLKDLSTPRKWGSWASSINNFGEVAGNIISPKRQFQAAIWIKRQRYDFGLRPGYTNSEAVIINDQHQVLVIFHRIQHQGKQIADTATPYLWQKGCWKAITALTTQAVSTPSKMKETGDISAVYSMNNHGDILVQWTEMPRFKTIALLWRKGHVQRITGFADLRNLNDRDQILGDIGPTAAMQFGKRPALWQSGKFQLLSSLLPKHPTYHLHAALAINNRGQIILDGTDHGKRCFFLLTPIIHKGDIKQ